MACAWHRQVRLLGIVVRLSPHHKPSRFALRRRSQAHATKKTTRIKRKTKPKARRRGAVPAEPLGIGCRFFRSAHPVKRSLSLHFRRRLRRQIHNTCCPPSNPYTTHRLSSAYICPSRARDPRSKQTSLSQLERFSAFVVGESARRDRAQKILSR